MKEHTTGKVYSLFFETFLLEITKFLFWHVDMALGGHSMKFKHFPNIS